MLPVFKSPSRKIIPSLFNSREGWKSKYKELKIEYRNLERRHEYISDRTSELKAEILKLKSQLAEHEVLKKRCA